MSGPRLLYTAGGLVAYASLVKLAHMSVTCMKESPENSAKHLTVPQRKIFTVDRIRELKDQGIVVIDNVLSAEELKLTRAEIFKLVDHTTEFISDPNDDLTVRSDSIMWISEKINSLHKPTVPSALLKTLQFLRAIPHEMVSDYGYSDDKMGVPLSCQLGCYDGAGANYVAHRDAPAEQGNTTWFFLPGIYDRELTFVLYLNKAEWDSTTTDGENCNGNLRCFLGTEDSDITGSTAKKVLNVEPIGGRLVVFDSKRVLHAVLPTSHRRLALTAWVGGDHSRYQMLQSFCIPLNEIEWHTE